MKVRLLEDMSFIKFDTRPHPLILRNISVVFIHLLYKPLLIGKVLTNKRFQKLKETNMKKIMILLMTLFFTVLSHGSEVLYSALDVEEKIVHTKRTTLKYEKTVGGLTCIKTNVIRQGDNFNCSFTLNAYDSEALYNALDVEETPVSADRMTLIYQKFAAPLTCTKTNVIQEGDSFSCSLSI